jgi:HIRAN domain
MVGRYAPIHEHSDGEHHFIALGERLSNSRVPYCKVAGARDRPEALEDSRFKPGSVAMLRPEPDSPYDANAVNVWGGSGFVQVGYIPADCCLAFDRHGDGEGFAGSRWSAPRNVRRIR